MSELFPAISPAFTMPGNAVWTALVAAVLLVYLTYALLKPDRF